METAAIPPDPRLIPRFTASVPSTTRRLRAEATRRFIATCLTWWLTRRRLHCLKPEAGSEGAKDLLARYGMNLLCVRYRHEQDQRERWKPAEAVAQPGTLRDAR